MMYSQLQPAILTEQSILPKKNVRKTEPVSMGILQKTVALVVIKIRHVTAIRHRVKEPAGKTVYTHQNKSGGNPPLFIKVLP